MPRRIALPGANELFRSPEETGEAGPPSRMSKEAHAGRRGTGRVRHDEKITVYVSGEELLELERARLTLRGHGLAVDRGRIVREAIAMALEDLDARDEDSDLVHRLHR